MSGLSHLSGNKGRGRGRAATNKPPRAQQLHVPGRGLSPKPAHSVPVTPKWGPNNRENGRAAEEAPPPKLPKYVIPDNVEFLSSDEEDEVDDQVLEKVLSRYGEDEHNIKNKLADIYNTSSSNCLVCLSTVRHAEPIWSCSTCSDSFHLVCIQKWARDGIKAPSVLSDELFPDRDIPWFCPKCRHEFSKAQIPTKYYCYCNKKPDPVYDPWIAPHSCGEVCDSPLSPACGHSCLLLCHPGRCPPCPKQVVSSCFCGRKSNEIRRCGQAKWSCGDICKKTLQCGIHTCNKLCHEGDCAPCERESLQKCRCGKESSLRQCLNLDWQCARVCSAPLPCGNHRCMKVCHPPTECEPCEPSLRTSCPCGKTQLPENFPCNQAAPVCEQSCDKELPCGAHECFKLCHLGKCDECRQVRDKPCRCSRTHKVVPCSQEVTCEIKCNKQKECNRHSCKKKCCPGSGCGACDKRCDKTLPCRNHKCVNDCHPGRCYPCPEKVDVTCACSRTRTVVACGRERTARPPRCNRPCTAPSDCHHEERKPHRCHFKACPPCKDVCGLQLEKCEHVCAAPCHHLALVPSRGPGDPTYVKKPCPPCAVLEHLPCLGNHEISTTKCSELSPYSCLRECGRVLSCGNHTCTMQCHDPLQLRCLPCEDMCGRARKCAHPCTRACHEDACPPCRQYLRVPCHCGILHLSVKCADFSDKKDLSSLLSCGSKCSKIMECGHTCKKTCHLGACSMQSECKKKVYLYCTCKKVKKEHKCGQSFGRESQLAPPCDESCKEKGSEAAAVVVLPNKEVSKEAQKGAPKKRWRGRDRSEEKPGHPSFARRHGAKLGTLGALVVALAGIYFCTLEP